MFEKSGIRFTMRFSFRVGQAGVCKTGRFVEAYITRSRNDMPGEYIRKVCSLNLMERYPMKKAASEFEEYDRSSVIIALCEAIFLTTTESGSDMLNTLIMNFNNQHAIAMRAKAFVGDACDRNVKDAIHGIDVLDLSDGERVNVDLYVKKLTETYQDILSNYQNEEGRRLYSESAKAYLDAFFAVSQKCVFNEKNFNLYDYTFRSSTFLKTLMTFASTEEEGVRVFDPWDPFALDALSRALVCSAELSKCARMEKLDRSDLLFAFRVYLLNCSVESSFDRYMTLNGLTYRIELNRHRSKLIGQRMRDISSTCETKPLRLFEKTAVYIRNNMSGAGDTLVVRVCIIGHTEPTCSGMENPLEDYILAVLYWYSQLERNDERIPKLDLRVRNIVNTADARSADKKTFRKDICLPKFAKNCRASYEIAVENYEERFTFNTQYIEKEIRNSQIVFLLDCPWLSVENYEIGESSSLDTYCELLKYRKREEPDCLLNFNTDFSAFYKRSTMRRLGAQYNRIMGSKSLQAGYVVRSMKDALIRRIQHIVENTPLEDGWKELYIFSSENEGIDFSYVSTYPLTRQERYDGKSFDIIQFKNHPSRMLECLKPNKSVSFRISLWSILKYICVSFAYCEFKERLLQCLEIDSLEDPILIWALYDGIAVIFNVGQRNMTDVRITLTFDKSVRTVLEQFDCGLDTKKVIDGLKALTRSLIEPLYRKCVFSADQQYGDDAIKTAFEMNLQSAAENVDTMYFLHKYRVARRTGTLDRFKLTFATAVTEKEVRHDFLGHDFFMDKKLYNSVFSALERSAEYSMGLLRMLKYADGSGCFKKEDNVPVELHIARKIVEVCKRYGDEESFLAINASQKQN